MWVLSTLLNSSSFYHYVPESGLAKGVLSSDLPPEIYHYVPESGLANGVLSSDLPPEIKRFRIVHLQSWHQILENVKHVFPQK